MLCFSSMSKAFISIIDFKILEQQLAVYSNISYLFCFPCIIKESPLPSSGNWLSCFPGFYPHIAWNLHSGAQFSFQNHVALFINHFLFNVIPGWVPPHKIFQKTTWISCLKQTKNSAESNKNQQLLINLFSKIILSLSQKDQSLQNLVCDLSYNVTFKSDQMLKHQKYFIFAAPILKKKKTFSFDEFGNKNLM